MSLLALKQHLQQVKMASLRSLCVEMQAEPQTMRCLLSHWMTKGKIKKCLLKPACGTKCFNCPSDTTELYEWVETRDAIPNLHYT